MLPWSVGKAWLPWVNVYCEVYFRSIHAIDRAYIHSDVKLDGISTDWNKGFSDEYTLSARQGQNAVAISAFHLSEAKNDIERKDIVKQMWNSGAETIVSLKGVSSLVLAQQKTGSHRPRHEDGVFARHRGSGISLIPRKPRGDRGYRCVRSTCPGAGKTHCRITVA